MKLINSNLAEVVEEQGLRNRKQAKYSDGRNHFYFWSEHSYTVSSLVVYVKYIYV